MNKSLPEIKAEILRLTREYSTRAHAAQRPGGDANRPAFVPGEKIAVRNPRAVRPWQHVLEPLSGYLTLASLLVENPSLATAFNFGPGPDSNRTVEDLVTKILKNRIGSWTNVSDTSALHEATLLNLSIQKALRLLAWEPKWSFEETIRKTVSWYESVHTRSMTPLEITRSQIVEYQRG